MSKYKRPITIVVTLLLAMFALFSFMSTSAIGGQAVCSGLDSGKIDTSGDPQTVTATAPEGFLINKYCVKAGSDNGNSLPDGVSAVQNVNVEPPKKTVVISHTSGKAVSHYSYGLVEVVIPTPTPTPTEPSPTPTEPTPTPTEPTPTPTEPTPTPTEPSPTPTVTDTETPTPTPTEPSPTPTTTEPETEEPSASPTTPNSAAPTTPASTQNPDPSNSPAGPVASTEPEPAPAEPEATPVPETTYEDDKGKVVALKPLDEVKEPANAKETKKLAKTGPEDVTAWLLGVAIAMLVIGVATKFAASKN